MLPMLPKDKANHALYGVVIFAILSLPLQTFIALGLTILIGAIKELYDEITGTGVSDIADAGYTALGAVLGAIIYEGRTIVGVLF